LFSLFLFLFISEITVANDMMKFETDLNLGFGKVHVLGGCNIEKSYYYSNQTNSTALVPGGHELTKNSWSFDVSFHLAEWLHKAIDGIGKFFKSVSHKAKEAWEHTLSESISVPFS
jgi:hypothetical protein